MIEVIPRKVVHPLLLLFALLSPSSNCFVVNEHQYLIRGKSFSIGTTTGLRQHLTLRALPRNSGVKRQHEGARFDDRTRVRRQQRLTLRKRPEQIEADLARASDRLRKKIQQSSNSEIEIELLQFPTIRECNSALAALGDAGELLRALRLFGKMRKSANMQADILAKTGLKCLVPVPTLVTYSTLMSRAVRGRKPLVALRLWRMMGDEIVPDLKAANILMNCYAKLGDANKAKELLRQMKSGNGYMVPRIRPNIVTYNTLLHACQRAGDLDGAIATKEDLDTSGLRSDARTYTSLIATVARKRSRSSGKNDPSLAFTLLEEMEKLRIRPNGMTYSALIDVCGRCRRSDLALQGLRIMLRQKAAESKLSRAPKERYILENEVGAWTAAINACGKSGRLETALRLFHVAMPDFGCKPNTVTCGCMVDNLLRAGRTAETLEVLRFMKENKITPSEVMYTSLMTHAERLVKIENSATDVNAPGDSPDAFSESDDTTAITVYTELMQFLMDGGKSKKGSSPPTAVAKDGSKTELLRVFLIFQQMKAAEATPDIACFNTLLRACARSGELKRAKSVMQDIIREGLTPNDISWRELLKCAVTQKRGDLAEKIWSQALTHGTNHKFIDDSKRKWHPSTESLYVLLSALVVQAAENSDPLHRAPIYRKIVSLYNGALLADDKMGMDRIDTDDLLSDPKCMMLILIVSVALADISSDENERRECRSAASAIQSLHIMKNLQINRLSSSAKAALKQAREWAKEL